jgi:predicted ferric reductase
MPFNRNAQFFLLMLLAATTVVPLLFIQFDEPTSQLQAYKLLAKLGSLAGAVLMCWQFLLGFRGAVARWVPDYLWLLKVHRAIGKYILLLVLLHPVFITLYYLEKHHRNVLLLDLKPPADLFVLLGMIALLLLLDIVVTGLFRQSFKSYSLWYSIHLSSYIMLPLVFVHSFPIGMTVRKTGLWYLWWGLAAALVAFILLRLFVKLGWLAQKHVVSEVVQVGPQVTRIAMRPVNGKLAPETGQFIYLRWGIWGGSRPFTVSHYDRASGEIAVTVKALGKTTSRLQTIRPGETMYIEGPYGIFTRAALATGRPLVMIAGGIGITPFLRLFEELAYEPGRELHLFYGNKYTGEIVYKEEIEDHEHVKIIHVLSHEADYPGERGFITMGLLRKYLERELREYEFLLCGPPVMTEKLRESLAGETVPAEQIHFEFFSY